MVVDCKPAHRVAISALSRAGVEARAINLPLDRELVASRRARARGSFTQLRTCSQLMNRWALARWRRRDRGPFAGFPFVIRAIRSHFGGALARWCCRDRGPSTGTHARKSHVGSGRLLPQLRALDLPIDRGAGGQVSANSTQLQAGVCANSQPLHDRDCGFRTSSPAAARGLEKADFTSDCAGFGAVEGTPNIAFAQSPPGIGRKRPSLPGQLPGDRASAVPLQLPQMRPVRIWRRKPLC